MTLMHWLGIAVAVVWVGGLPVVYGAQKRYTSHPEPLSVALWFPLFVLWLAVEGLRLLRDAIWWTWTALEDMGYQLAGR